MRFDSATEKFWHLSFLPRANLRRETSMMNRTVKAGAGKLGGAKRKRFAWLLEVLRFLDTFQSCGQPHVTRPSACRHGVNVCECGHTTHGVRISNRKVSEDNLAQCHRSDVGMA